MHAAGRLAFPVFLAAVLGYGGAFAYYTLASFDVVNLHRDAFFDDAFYYFEIAKNLAAGEFFTFDGGITRTNGYHPVWLLLVTPFYWVFDLELALFGIRALEIMLIAGSVCLLALAMRVAQLPWILLFAVSPALYGHRGMIWGMEAAAGGFFLGATLLAAVLFARDAVRWRWLLAGVAFLLPWVRFEYAAIALLVTGGLALLPGRGAARDRPLGYFSAVRLRAVGLPFAAAVVGILAYFLYNGVVFGGILPVSGAAKVAMSALWTGPEGVAWRSVAGRFVDAAGRDGVAVAELCVYVLAVWGVCRRGGWSNDAVGLLAVLGTVLTFGVENLAVRALVAALYDARIEGYVHWYWAPGYLTLALLMPLRCYVAIFFLRRFLPARWTRWRRPAVVAVCAGGMALAFDPYAFTEPFRSVRESRHASSAMHARGFAQELTAFERMLPDDAVLGSWEAGAIGYFAERPVVNLDGVASSYEYLRADPDKWGLWRQRGGIPAFGVTHLVNSAPDAGDLRGRFAYVGSRALGGASLKLWRHGTASAPSKPWRSITSPSFGVDGEPSGYRVIRHGRLLQVFVPDCVHRGPAANLPEMLAFAWREGAEIRRETRLWVLPQRTGLGYCAMRFLLPHGAETAPDILIDGIPVNGVLADTPPLLRAPSGVSVYAVQNRLLYVREVGENMAECPRQDVRYFLHLYPAARRDLAYRRQAHGFVDYGGLLTAMRRQVDTGCFAEVELPAFRIREAVTGETVQGRRTWQARVDALALPQL